MIKTWMQPLRPVAWQLVKAWVRCSFPTVPSLTPQELAAQLEDGEEFPPIVIDARENEEFVVSHLPEAYPARDIETVQQLGISPAQPIVVYCSIGYRSARLVEKLRKAGFAAAENLEGSIFQWANEGRPLMRHGELVQEVHPYNGVWGLLLDQGMTSDKDRDKGSHS